MNKDRTSVAITLATHSDHFGNASTLRISSCAVPRSFSASAGPMPWLIREKDGVEEQGRRGLLYVHIPRCGGTSMSTYYKVPEQSRSDRTYLGSLTMRFFFYRYQLYETANFPWRTWETLWSMTTLLAGCTIYALLPGYHRQCSQTAAFASWEVPLCTLGYAPYFCCCTRCSSLSRPPSWPPRPASASPSGGAST